MKTLWIIISFGFLLRIILSAITFHPDLQVFNITGEIVASGNILNLYDYIPNLSNNDPLKNLVILNYPPSIYLFHGMFNFFFSSILKLPFINEFIFDQSSNYGNILFNLHLIFLKLPYIIFDFLTALFLFKSFKDRRNAQVAVILWVFNPINLYATYMMGQFDIIPTFFTVLAFYLVGRRKIFLASLALGCGVAFKVYPLFLVIPLMLSSSNLLHRIKILILSVVPYLLSILPYIFSHNFRSTALFANQNTKSLYASLPISGGESILVFPFLLIFLYLTLWHIKRVEFWKITLDILLLFFIFTHFHPQWLLWLTPFLVIELTINSFKNSLGVVLIVVSFVASLFFFDSSLTINFFAPLFPVLKNMPSIWKILNLNPDYNLARSIVQTIFASSAAYFIYRYFPRQENV